jgi:hypothetical protein
MAAKLGDIEAGTIFVETAVDVAEGAKVGAVEAGPEGAKLGDAAMCAVEGVAEADTVGRKFGEVAKESVRFCGGDVARRAWKSGDVDGAIAALGSLA